MTFKHSIGQIAMCAALCALSASAATATTRKILDPSGNPERSLKIERTNRTDATLPSRVKVILDSDMLTDFDDVGALACLHALADAGECEILATLSCTRGNSSVAAIEVINGYYGRPGIPVGCAKGMGVSGGGPNCDSKKPLSEGDHGKYVKLAKDYPQWVKHANSDDAPDANEVYRRVLAAQPDHSVVICSIGFLTNLRRLLETKPDAISPLDGRALVAKKVKKWVAMACNYPKGKEYNSRWDAESSRIALADWPTPVVISDFQYGFDTYAGRAIAEKPGPRNPVKDIFRDNIPIAAIDKDPAVWRGRCFGRAGRSAWDETAVLAAVRGETSYFGTERGTYRMVGTAGDDEWAADAQNGRHLRLVEKMPKAEVGKLIDELICRPPRNAIHTANKPVFVNYDDTHFGCSRSKAGVVPDENEIRGLVRQYRGTDVSDLLFCIAGRIADVPLCVYSLGAYPEKAAVVEVLPDEPVTLTYLGLEVSK